MAVGLWLMLTLADTPTPQDNDLNYKPRFHPEQAPAVAEQLARDSLLLCRHNIMDYSLLLGVMIAEYDIGEEGAAASGGGGGGGGDGSGERLFSSVGGDDEGRMGATWWRSWWKRWLLLLLLLLQW